MRIDNFEKYVAGRFDELSRESKEIKTVDTPATAVELEVRVDVSEREIKIGA